MLKQWRIVLVDDHEGIRKALREFLSSYDHLQIVGEAADGKQAIDIASSCQPDVVVMDINMPRMNGIQATKLIKQTWNQMVVVGLCTVPDTQMTDAFLKAGASAVVVKSRIEDIYPAIQQACDKNRN